MITKKMLRKEWAAVSDVIRIRMFGEFSIEYNGQCVNDRNNRMRKLWLLLARMVYSRNSVVTQGQYLELFQNSGSDEAADPKGKLKAMLYRVRTLLNQLEENAGHDWVLRKGDTYAWNTDVPVELDVEIFEKLCAAAVQTGAEEQRLKLYNEALALYQGDFLPKLGGEPWVMPLAAYYHKLYLNTVEQTLALLEDRGLWTEAAQLCEKALKIEPYGEEIYQHLMHACIAGGERRRAVRAYEEMSELLFATFGVMPSDESRALYREACREEVSHAVPVGAVRDQLRETSAAAGALYCEYDFFKMLYQMQARAIIRSGDTIHIALLSLHGEDGDDLARRSLDRAMDNLQEIIVGGLRQGDVVTRCSASQFIVMLPQANYENSCAVCERLVKSFTRQYPHSPARIHTSVHPLEPLDALQGSHK